MKRILFMLILLAATGVALKGQMTDQGNFLIGSQLGLSAATSKLSSGSGSGMIGEESPTSTILSISPGAGYFLIDNLTLGIRLDYSFTQVKESGLREIEDSDLLFGPFMRYYYPFGKDMAMIVEAGFGFGNSSDIQNIGDVQQRINTNIFAVGVGPGLTIFSGSGIGLEAFLKYKYARSDFDTEFQGIKQNVITKTNHFDISLGIQWYFAGIKRVQTTY